MRSPDLALGRAGLGIGLALGLAVGLALSLVGLAAGFADPVRAADGFMPPVPGQRVYDTAGVFEQWMIAQAERTIAGIEQRTGAQVVVYSQDVDAGVSTGEAQAQAASLMDQWGVGRKGFDDGLVMLFDIDPSGCHGQVQLYAGAGFRATFMSDADRQHVFDDTMLPYLHQCRLGQAMLSGLAAIDASATPAHAASLERARQVDAVIGLVLAPIAFLLLSIWAAWNWLRHGRDPVYLDDPSIHLPAPPPDLTPATGALVFEGRTSQRAFTTALMDLASRGELVFDQLDPGARAKVAI
ncbi:MAG TPA: TPM domain-containing protein, partial [Candidatus Limnocylindrales bacterium]